MPCRAEIFSQTENFGIWQLRLIAALSLPALAAGILGAVDRFTLQESIL
jgi:hypothetical protein